MMKATRPTSLKAVCWEEPIVNRELPNPAPLHNAVQTDSRSIYPTLCLIASSQKQTVLT